MKPTQAIISCYSKYFTFSGRASRAEFWWFVLFVTLVTLLLRAIDYAMFGIDPDTGMPTRFLSNAFALLSTLPLFTAGWRRLHDVGKPGWLMLAPFLLSGAFIIAALAGVSLFALLEQSQSVMKLAYFLGVVALLVYAILSAALTLWLVWWLIKPATHLRSGPQSWKTR